MFAAHGGYDENHPDVTVMPLKKPPPRLRIADQPPKPKKPPIKPGLRFIGTPPGVTPGDWFPIRFTR